MKKYFMLVSALLFIWGICIAAEKTESVQPNMHEMYSQLKNLMSFMMDNKKFVDDKNKKVINDHLQKIITQVKGMKGKGELNHSTMEISRDALEKHFINIQNTFQSGNKNYALWALNSTVPLCMSCHTQSPSSSRHWNLEKDLSAKMNTFGKAELSFMGRDFDAALKGYDDVIDNFPANKSPVIRVEKSLQRKVVIFTRVKRDFNAGIKSLESSSKNKQLPDYLQKNIKAWIALFRIQLRDGFPDPEKSSDTVIKKYVEKSLKRELWDDMIDAENPRLVKYLTISGILYEYLAAHPKSEIKPDILNWLAICERQLQDTLFYSLADLYLIQCMSEFTSDPTAKKCYKEYKENTILSYTGSSGLNLPEDVKKDLREWSIKIFGKDTSLSDQ